MAAAGQAGSSYLMLYNYATARVDHLFAANSPDLVAW